MNAKTKLACIFIALVFIVSILLCASYIWAGNVKLATAQTELVRSQKLVADMARINEVERSRLDLERESINRARSEIVSERGRLAKERIEFTRARESFIAERERLARELDAYNRIEKLLSDSLKIIDGIDN